VKAGAALLAAFVAVWATMAQAQTLHGVTLGEPLTADLPPPERVEDFGRYQLQHYALSPRLALTLWTRSGDAAEVLSIQIARTAPYVRDLAPLDGFEFGATTTAAIERRFGPAGPVYEIIGAETRHGRITSHTMSYELESGDAVVTFTTLEARDQPDSRGRDNARLDAIILARRWFQEELWGAVSYPNPGYEPIPSPF
jgi:hypothetical protein